MNSLPQSDKDYCLCLSWTRTETETPEVKASCPCSVLESRHRCLSPKSPLQPPEAPLLPLGSIMNLPAFSLISLTSHD